MTARPGAGGRVSTPQAWWLVIRGRACCWLLGHQKGVQISHGYAVLFCNRCWGFEIQRLPEVPS